MYMVVEEYSFVIKRSGSLFIHSACKGKEKKVILCTPNKYNNWKQKLQVKKTFFFSFINQEIKLLDFSVIEHLHTCLGHLQLAEWYSKCEAHCV